VIDATVLIVTHESAATIGDCLRSLPSSASASTLEVVVIDNASSDGSGDLVLRDYPEVRLITLESNVGFARACNQAGKDARGEFVFLVNPDTILHVGALDGLIAFARANPQYGVYGGRALDPSGEVHWNSCWAFPSLWSLACFASGLSTAFPRTLLFDPESMGSWARDSLREVDAVTGYLTLVKAEIWRELGGFDPRYFLYGEDLDFCLRARRRGHRPVIVPEVVLTHLEGVSSPDPTQRMVRILQGKLTFLARHLSPWKRPLGVGLTLCGVWLRAVLGSRKWRAVWRRRAEWSSGY
jgi:N-acetylglucosaminyl-diphospho-decaprenol L-rhamnosyltransferase